MSFRKISCSASSAPWRACPLGKALHAFVMSQIRIDMIRFDVRVSLLSYGLAVVLTFAFAILVNFALRFKLEKINMAESLKTVE